MTKSVLGPLVTSSFLSSVQVQIGEPMKKILLILPVIGLLVACERRVDDEPVGAPYGTNDFGVGEPPPAMREPMPPPPEAEPLPPPQQQQDVPPPPPPPAEPNDN
jgi:hypothetical protein